MSLPWDRFGEPPAPPPPPPQPEPVPVPTPPVPVPPTWTFEPSPSPLPTFPPTAALEPYVPPPDLSGSDLVKADAVSRSKRTLIQGLLFDLFAAVVASIAMLSGADPFVKETWIGFAILLIKSVVSAGISYFMRLKHTPTMKTTGTKMAIMPVPRPIVETKGTP